MTLSPESLNIEIESALWRN
jgi:hypothetical protein